MLTIYSVDQNMSVWGPFLVGGLWQPGRIQNEMRRNVSPEFSGLLLADKLAASLPLELP
jgi:hypothetical protein